MGIRLQQVRYVIRESISFSGYNPTELNHKQKLINVHSLQKESIMQELGRQDIKFHQIANRGLSCLVVYTPSVGILYIHLKNKHDPCPQMCIGACEDHQPDLPLPHTPAYNLTAKYK